MTITLLEKVVRGNWTIELHSNGSATLRPHYYNQPNYLYKATWDAQKQAPVLDVYDSEYQPRYLHDAVRATFKRHSASFKKVSAT